MQWVILVVLLLLSSLPLAVYSHGTSCNAIDGQPGCVCKTSKGIIDLTTLSYNNGTPRFTGMKDLNNYIYSYNPCYPYSEMECKDAYICQWEDDGSKKSHNIADHSGFEKILFNEDDKLYYVSYNTTNQIVESTHVRLHCDYDISVENTTMTTLGDTTPEGLMHYYFDIYSCQVCPGGCQRPKEQIAGIIGAVVIALFIAAVLIYFIAGALIMKFHYHANGSDVIPNKTFWMEAPLLVKDGVVFTFSPCTERLKSRREYMRIQS